MSLNNTPSAERTHIGIFGRRNAGKSSVINAITGQDLAIVSDVKGTTTDPVSKAMEILPLGPVVLIDTPGLDDVGELGEKRIKKAYQVLNKTDIALLVVDGREGMRSKDREILERIQKKGIPHLIVYNKKDLCEDADARDSQSSEKECNKNADHTKDGAHASGTEIFVSAVTGEGIHELKEAMAHLLKQDQDKKIIGDFLSPLDVVVLVVPIDSSAPKGRLILPQQQTIRDILDVGAVPVVVRDTELRETLEKLQGLPKMVITDSQAFGKVAPIVPKEIPLTSFSILMARYKGNLSTVVRGVRALDTLKDGANVLIAEGCTHHRQCEDIGTVKLPKWVKEYTGKELTFSFCSGTAFPEDLTGYDLIIHCGGCMLNEREMKYRLQCAEDAGVPITNYGTTIAQVKGILARSVELFESEL